MSPDSPTDETPTPDSAAQQRQPDLAPETGCAFVPDGGRDERVRVDDTELVSLAMWRCETARSEYHTVELIDISRAGVKLRSPVCLRFDESVMLAMEIKEAGVDCDMRATVRHLRAAENGDWIIGCAIRPRLSDDALERIASIAAVERRRSTRKRVAIDVMARHEIAKSGEPGQVCNLSTGGLSLLWGEDCCIDDLLCLEFADRGGRKFEVHTSVCWRVASDEGFLTGCKFVSDESYVRLRSLLDDDCDADDAPGGVWQTAAACGGALLAITLMAWGAVNVTWQGDEAAASTAQAAQVAEPPQVAEAPEPEQSTAPAEQTPRNKAATVASSHEVTDWGPLFTPPQATAADPPTRDAAPTPSATPAPAEPQPREWVDNSQKFRVRATLVETGDGYVRLLKENGRVATVPLSRLSETDIEYVESHPTSGD